MSSKRRHSVAAVLAACAVTGLGACGGGGHSSSQSHSNGQSGERAQSGSDVVASVSGAPITRSQVDHWMQTLAGRDYYTVSHHLKLPEGLVSDPPDYGRCVARLEAAASSAPGAVRESSGQLLAKCQQLYTAIRTQATTYLVGAQRAIGLGRELGVTVSSGAVEHGYKQIKAREYATEADYQHYLASTGESVADGLLETKLEMIGNEVLKKASSSIGRVQFALAEEHLASKVSCKAGFVVEYCQGYKSPKTYSSSPPPSVLMEQVATLVTGHCVNLAACGEQQNGK